MVPNTWTITGRRVLLRVTPAVAFPGRAHRTRLPEHTGFDKLWDALCRPDVQCSPSQYCGLQELPAVDDGHHVLWRIAQLDQAHTLGLRNRPNVPAHWKLALRRIRPHFAARRLSRATLM